MFVIYKIENHNKERPKLLYVSLNEDISTEVREEHPEKAACLMCVTVMKVPSQRWGGNYTSCKGIICVTDPVTVILYTLLYLSLIITQRRDFYNSFY